MREILFRGQILGSCEWIYGYYRLGRKTHFIYFEEDSDNCYVVRPESVGQFIGLTDKNDNKIFEGDVVKFTDSVFGYSYSGLVCFHEGSFCIKYEFLKELKFHRIGLIAKWQDMGASGIVTYQYEILGNILDNSELLEKS